MLISQKNLDRSKQMGSVSVCVYTHVYLCGVCADCSSVCASVSLTLFVNNSSTPFPNQFAKQLTDSWLPAGFPLWFCSRNRAFPRPPALLSPLRVASGAHCLSLSGSSYWSHALPTKQCLQWHHSGLCPSVIWACLTLITPCSALCGYARL